MDPVIARKMWRTLEPYHAMIYAVPEAAEAYHEIGLPESAHYFASRAAPMGAVSAQVVAATFYNFSPALVGTAIPAAWDHAAPSTIVEARLGAADRALRGLLGDEVIGSPELAAAAETARRAAQEAPPEGRALCAGHAGLDWPEEPHLVLWHAITLLREFRGDGHIGALTLCGFDACEAVVSYAATNDPALPADALRLTRGWTDAEWEGAEERLRERGWMDADGALTPEGLAGRDQVEDITDQLAMAPWEALGEEACDELRSAVRPWSKAIAASGTFSRLPGGLVPAGGSGPAT